jgi:hypothetical protein
MAQIGCNEATADAFLVLYPSLCGALRSHYHAVAALLFG